MRIVVNDAEMSVAEQTSVAALVASLGFPDRGIAVAVNSAVLPRSQWDRAVPADARIDVVTAVQGG